MATALQYAPSKPEEEPSGQQEYCPHQSLIEHRSVGLAVVSRSERPTPTPQPTAAQTGRCLVGSRAGSPPLFR